MSFFDDDEPPARSPRTPRSPQPRRPASRSVGGPDHQTIVIRRAIAFGGGLLAIIVIVLLISSCESSAALDALRNYNNDVVKIARDSEHVGALYYSDLAGAQGQSAAVVRPELDALNTAAEQQVSTAQGLSAPSGLSGAQHDLVLALQLRQEAVADTAAQIGVALGGLGDAGPALKRIAGDGAMAFASDVLFQVRVRPLIAEQLASNSISPLALPSSTWLHDLNWTQQGAVATRLTGAAGTGTNGTALAPGTHGHSLTGVSVGSTTLAARPAINNLTGGSPTFQVTFQNTGSNPETGVTVQVSVTALGQTRTASATKSLTQPGQSYTLPVTVTGVPAQVPASIADTVEPVPGEKNVANNTQKFTAVFG